MFAKEWQSPRSAWYAPGNIEIFAGLQIFDLYHKHILDPITQGTLFHDAQHSSIGAQMFAARKSDPTAARPVTHPDCDISIATAVLCQLVYHTPAVLDYFEIV